MQDRTCLVISAVGGIGRTLVELLHRDGWSLVLADRTADPNRTTSQPVIVHSSSGDMTYYVNLQQNGHQWFLLGNHTFSAGCPSRILYPFRRKQGLRLKE